MMGATPEQAAADTSEAGADVIGSNCGQGIAGFCDLPPAGTTPTARLDQGQRRPAAVGRRPGDLTMSPLKFAMYVPALIDAGAISSAAAAAPRRGTQSLRSTRHCTH